MKKKLEMKSIALLLMLTCLAFWATVSCSKNEFYYEDCAGILTCRYQLSDGRVFDCTVDQINGKIVNDKDSLLFGTNSSILSAIKPVFSTTIGAKVFVNGRLISSGSDVIDLSKPVNISTEFNGAKKEYNMTAYVEKLDHSQTSGAKINTDMRVTGLPQFNSMSSTFFKGKIYILGAYYPNGTSSTGSSFYELYESTDGTQWKKVATNPTIVGGFGAELIVLNNKMYAIGGARLYGKDINGLTEDAGSIKWRVMSTTNATDWNDCTVGQINAPSGRAFPQICVHNGKIILRRGKAVGFGMWQSASHSDTYQTTDCTNWTRVSVNTTTATNRSDDAMFSFNNKLWITGGYSSFISETNVKNDIWSSVDEGLTWVQETTAVGNKLNRFGHRVVVSNGIIYMIGGEAFEGGARVGVTSVQKSEDGINWSLLPQNTQLPLSFTSRIYPNIFMGEGNTIWIIGGYAASAGSYAINGLNMISRYDVWTKKMK